jgi:hypothetical protein
MNDTWSMSLPPDTPLQPARRAATANETVFSRRSWLSGVALARQEWP